MCVCSIVLVVADEFGNSMNGSHDEAKARALTSLQGTFSKICESGDTPIFKQDATYGIIFVATWYWGLTNGGTSPSGHALQPMR